MNKIYQHTSEDVWSDSIAFTLGVMAASEQDIFLNLLKEQFLDSDKIAKYFGIEEGLTPERIARVNHALDSVRLMLGIPLLGQHPHAQGDGAVDPIVEPTEERVARGDWQSKTLGYRYTIRAQRKIGLSCEAEGFPSEEAALLDAENRIDAQIDSL